MARNIYFTNGFKNRRWSAANRWRSMWTWERLFHKVPASIHTHRETDRDRDTMLTDIERYQKHSTIWSNILQQNHSVYRTHCTLPLKCSKNHLVWFSACTNLPVGACVPKLILLNSYLSYIRHIIRACIQNHSRRIAMHKFQGMWRYGKTSNYVMHMLMNKGVQLNANCMPSYMRTCIR